MPLTNIQVKQAKPDFKDKKIFDAHGLFLLIKPNGHKYWRLKYRFAGKEKLLALGVYPEVTLAEARLRRHEAKKQLSENLDPMEVKKQKKWLSKINSENSFQSIAIEWWGQKKGLWSNKHATRVLSSLQKDIFPSIGLRPIAEIKTPELLLALRKVESRNALDVASRLLQRCTQIFRYAIQTGRTHYNPAVELVGTLKTRKVQHQASLPRSELPSFLSSIANYDGHILTRLALRLLTLTFVRPGELRYAMWNELEIDNKLWRIPAERMKMNSEHIIPLSDQALAVIEELRPITKNYALLFPGTRNSSNPISENTLTYAIYRMGYKSRATPHGFRATASSILNEQGFNRDAIERQLAHQERNKVRGAYTHHAEYLDVRRQMMEWWGNFIEIQLKASN